MESRHFLQDRPLRRIVVNDESKTKKQLMEELAEMRRRVAELEASETKHKLLYERAPLGYQSLDEGSCLIEVNQAWLDMLGYTYEEVIDRWLGDIMTPECVDRYKQGFRRFKTAITRDITERKRAEEQLRRYNHELEEVVNERTARIQEMERQRAEIEKSVATGRMAARIAHEINNPLAGIGNSFLLLEDAIPKDHPHYEYVDRIKKEIERIARIVRQMFDLYRPEQEPSAEFLVAEVTRDIVSLFDASNQKNDVAIVAEIDDASTVANMPEGWLRQILFNVIQNAVDVSPSGASVKVSTEVTQDVLTILVADQGSGIPEETRSRILEPFFTTKDDPSQRGLGLGLSVSTSLAEAMGGSIDFQSEAGKGTVFQITLPLIWEKAKDVG